MPIDWNIVDDDGPPAPTEPSDALDARRIHAIVLERRATHRGRLRRVLVPIACAAVALMAIAATWRGGAPTRLACVTIIAGAIWMGVRAARARDASSDIARIDDSPPDFDALPDARSTAVRLADLEQEK